MRLILLLLTALLAACTVGPDYKAPDRQITPDWDGEVATPEAVRQDWWTVYGDPLLGDLIEATASHNPSLKAADARIREARARARAALSGRLPRVGAGAGYERARLSGNTQLGQIPGFELTNDTFNAGFDATWELDLWGKERRRIEAAEAALDATVFATRDLQVSLFAEVARAYAILRGTDQRLRLLEQNIELQTRTLATVQRQVAGGLADRSAMVRTETALRQIKARVPNLRAQRKAAAYAISTLTGQTPEALLYRLVATDQELQTPDKVRAGLRSDLLRRRPDIRIAERTLAAATAEIGVATADLYPSVGLTAAVGFESLDAGDLLESASRTWLVSPSIQLPIFDRGQLKALVEVKQAQAEAALHDFEQTVLNALLEAETALNTYAESLETRTRLTVAVETATESARLVKRRYEAGEDSLLDLLDAERQLIEIQDQLATAELTVRTDLAAVYKALGGGWSDSPDLVFHED